MSRSLKRLARRALIERQKDLYYHDLMQLRREQQLEDILRHVKPSVVETHHHHDNPHYLEHCNHDSVIPEYVIINEDETMSCPGPSSRDWMLVVMLVLGTAGMVLVLCLLMFLVINTLMSGGTGSVSIPLVQ